MVDRQGKGTAGRKESGSSPLLHLPFLTLVSTGQFCQALLTETAQGG